MTSLPVEKSRLPLVLRPRYSSSSYTRISDTKRWGESVVSFCDWPTCPSIFAVASLVTDRTEYGHPRNTQCDKHVGFPSDQKRSSITPCTPLNVRLPESPQPLNHRALRLRNCYTSTMLMIRPNTRGFCDTTRTSDAVRLAHVLVSAYLSSTDGPSEPRLCLAEQGLCVGELVCGRGGNYNRANEPISNVLGCWLVYTYLLSLSRRRAEVCCSSAETQSSTWSSLRAILRLPLC
jgi:hypothetical protein